MSSVRNRTTPRRRKLWLRLALVVGLVATIAAATVRWWLPAVASRIAATYGVTVSEWASDGWTRTEYRNLAYRRDGVEVRIGSAHVPLFGLFPRRTGGKPSIVVQDVVVKVTPQRNRPSKAPPSATEIVQQIDRMWAALVKQLPPARAENVKVEVGPQTYVLSVVTWADHVFEAQAKLPWRELEVAATLLSPSAGTWRVTAQSPGIDAEADVLLGYGASRQAEVSGSGTWRGNTVTLNSTFGDTGLMPRAAKIEAEKISVPAGEFGLKEYGPLTGSAHLDWGGDRYTLAVVAAADPVHESEWPPLRVDTHASGDLGGVTIEKVDITIPGVRAALSAPLAWSFSDATPVSAAVFAVDIDLAQVPASGATGRVTGELRAEPETGAVPELAFSLAGTDIVWREVTGLGLGLTGRWRKPELVLESATFEVGPDAKSDARGIINLDERSVREAAAHLEIPQSLLRALSPGAPPCERIQADVEASGSFATLGHKGSLVFSGLEWTRARLLGGAVSWTGAGAKAEVEGQLELPGGGTLPFAGRGARGGGNAISAELDRLQWLDARGEWWHLIEKTQFVLEPASGSIRLSPWRIEGLGFAAGGEADVLWPRRGAVTLKISGLAGERLGGVLPEAIRGGSIEELDLKATWNDGPVAINGTVRAMYSPVEHTAFSIEGEFVAKDDGLSFGSLQVAGEEGAVLRGVGRMPLMFSGTRDGFQAKMSRDGPIELDLASEPNPVFWKSIADLTGWMVEDPQVRCRFDGSIAAPRGRVEFAASALHPPKAKLSTGGELPRLDEVRLIVAADEKGLSIQQGVVAIDERWVTLTGDAPWDIWTQWRSSGQVAWRKARFQLASNPLPIEIASRVFPTHLAPVGEISIGIAHEPGKAFSGRIWLHGAALRPLGQLGTVRELNTELNLEGSRMVLARLDGQLSGQSVTASGAADVSDLDRLEFELHVKSSRVPLVRKSGLIVRAEVDLHLEQKAGQPAEVTGRMDFGPSVFDADLMSLLPKGGVTTPDSRPPYFSVDEKPFADWKLNVAMHGEGFMRINTPFYRDMLSTDFTLGGTLAEPHIVGWVWGNGGWVTFPFGRVSADQVLVTLSKENPYEPTLIVSGSGRVLGYDVRMEVTGLASDPRLLFTSDPPLSSHQVFLMLTTGAVPAGVGEAGVSKRASRVAFFLGRSLVSGLGLSRENDERLSVRSGENITQQGRETIIVEYELSGRWSIVGEYDRFDAYNGGLKFRLVDR